MNQVSVARPLSTYIPGSTNIVVGSALTDLQFGEFNIVQDSDTSPIYMVQIDDSSGNFPYPWTSLFVSNEYIFVDTNTVVYKIKNVINDKLMEVETNVSSGAVVSNATGYKVSPHYRYCTVISGISDPSKIDGNNLPLAQVTQLHNEMLLAPFYLTLSQFSTAILGT
jgi:hypothetical protein